MQVEGTGFGSSGGYRYLIEGAHHEALAILDLWTREDGRSGSFRLAVFSLPSPFPTAQLRGVKISFSPW